MKVIYLILPLILLSACCSCKGTCCSRHGGCLGKYRVTTKDRYFRQYYTCCPPSPCCCPPECQCCPQCDKNQ